MKQTLFETACDKNTEKLIMDFRLQCDQLLADVDSKFKECEIHILAAFQPLLDDLEQRQKERKRTFLKTIKF